MCVIVTTIGICPACDNEVTCCESDVVWTCPADLSEGSWQQQTPDARITEALREEKGIYSNCGEDFGFPCYDRIPLHGDCYENGSW